MNILLPLNVIEGMTLAKRVRAGAWSASGKY